MPLHYKSLYAFTISTHICHYIINACVRLYYKRLHYKQTPICCQIINDYMSLYYKHLRATTLQNIYHVSISTIYHAHIQHSPVHVNLVYVTQSQTHASTQTPMYLVHITKSIASSCQCSSAHVM